MPNKNTIAPKDLAQESDATKFPTALVIIWNNGGELKKANISQVVNANILKDSTPTQGSTNLITSGGVWGFTYSKANVDALIETINSEKANVADVYSKSEIDQAVQIFIQALDIKENIATKESFADNTSITLTDNTIYTASEPISTLSLEAQASGTSVVSFDTAASGAITITLPQTIKFAETPTFGNNEHWEIAVRNGYAVYTKYNIV